MIEKKKLLIGIAGSAGVGKDTAADYLSSTYNLARYAFAWPVKAGLANAFGLTADHLEHRALKEQVDPRYGMSPRRMMQSFGDWAKETFGEDVWRDIAKRAYEGMHVSPEMADVPGIVISDVRYPNEAEWIREHGVLLHVTRPVSDGYQPDNAGHSSEEGLEILEGEHVIENAGNVGDLYDALDRLAVKLRLEDEDTIEDEIAGRQADAADE